MSVIFSISITPPADDVVSKIDGLLRYVPDPPATDFASLCTLIESNLRVAAGMWGRCFRSEEHVSIEVVFDNSGRLLAGGSSKSFADVGSGNRNNASGERISDEGDLV